MNRRSVVTVALVMVGALTLGACGGGQATPATTPPKATPTASPAQATPSPAPTATPSGPQPRYGGVLQVRWYNEFRRPWDTWRSDSGFTYPYAKAMLSNLVQYRKENFQIRADLSDRWETSPDGKTYIFHLRKDARWHDGNPVTAKDILYNFQRGSDPQFSFNKSRVDPIATMDTPDDYTFRATLKDLSNAFLPQVATAFMLMYPAHVPDMAQWQKGPVGSGPFKFGSDKPNTAYEFVKNPGYFEKDQAGRQLPYLDGVVFNVIPDPGLAQSAFVTGRVHCGCTHAEFWVIRNEEKLRSDVPGIKIQSHLGALLQLYFNVKRAPFDSADFRRGIAIGLDKEQIGATFALGKTFRPTSALIPPTFNGQWGLPKEELAKIPGYTPDHAADLKVAQQKIQQSGIDPKKVKIEIIGPEAYRDLGDLLGSVLIKDLGLDTAVSIIATPELSARRARGDFQIYIMSDSGSIDDPADWYRDFITTGGSQNGGGYANPRFDDLLRSQDREPDPAKRRQLAWEAQRLELTDFPKAPLFFALGERATRAEVTNFKTGPLINMNFDWSDVWLEK